MKNILIILFLQFVLLSPLVAQNTPHNKLRYPSNRQAPSHFQLTPDQNSQILTRSNIHTFNGGVDTAWVRQYGSEGLENYDNPESVTFDRLGNIIVTGNVATIKYSPQGTFVWKIDQSAKKVFVGIDNTIYLTGRFGTSKYNPEGKLLWKTTVAGDALAYDLTGNIVVSVSDGIVKYNSSGEQICEIKNIGRFIGYDRAGNIYTYDAKYDSAGNLLWKLPLYQYILAIDSAGNGYYAGMAERSGSGWDYCTYKYDSSGVQRWSRYYSGLPGYGWDAASSIAVDDSGNVYVTGESQYATATIKYNAHGNQLWVDRYTECKNGASMLIDADGNINVAAKDLSRGTCIIRYLPSGEKRWVARYNQRIAGDYIFIDDDKDGNICAVTSSGGDYLIIKFSNFGDTAWSTTFSGPKKSIDVMSSLDIDHQGNVIVTGTSLMDYGDAITAIKYLTSGDTAWVRRYSGPRVDIFPFVSVDAIDNIYMTWTCNSDQYYDSYYDGDYATMKYNPTGDTAWMRTYVGPGAYSDEVSSIAVDGSGNVYVTGSSDGLATSSDIATIKYNSAGDSVWVRRYNGPANDYDFASSLAVDANGNTYVVGTTDRQYIFQNSFSGGDFVTIKYDAAGDSVWVRRYNGPANRTDIANSIAVDKSGNVYITGTSDYNEDGESLEGGNFTTIKYSPSGETIWVNSYSGPEYFSGWVTSIALDDSGNVFIIGNSNFDYATIKYNPNGSTAWIKRYDSGGLDSPSALAIDNAGNVYVTGVTGEGSATTIKYDRIGNEKWIAKFSVPGGFIQPVGLRLDENNNLFIAGTSHVNDNNLFTLIKYKQTLTIVESVKSEVPGLFSLEQNYPNPFNPSTTIRYALPSSANVKLTIHDILGREIATLVNEEQSAGWKEVEWNGSHVSSGIYFYKLTADKFVETKKLMLLK